MSDRDAGRLGNCDLGASSSGVGRLGVSSGVSSCARRSVTTTTFSLRSASRVSLLTALRQLVAPVDRLQAIAKAPRAASRATTATPTSSRVWVVIRNEPSL